MAIGNETALNRVAFGGISNSCFVYFLGSNCCFWNKSGASKVCGALYEEGVANGEGRVNINSWCLHVNTRDGEMRGNL